MSLDWNVSKVHNWEEVCKETASYDDHFHGISKGDRVWSTLTTHLPFVMMATGTRVITEEGLEEMYFRTALWEKTHGTFLRHAKDAQPRWITREDLRLHIGMSTNVTSETRAKWMKRFVTSFEEEIGFERS